MIVTTNLRNEIMWLHSISKVQHLLLNMDQTFVQRRSAPGSGFVYASSGSLVGNPASPTSVPLNGFVSSSRNPTQPQSADDPMALFFRLPASQTARLEPLHRQTFVTQSVARIVGLLALAALIVVFSSSSPASPAVTDLDTTLRAIENRYNHAQTLRLDFSESYIASRRPSQSESGTLYLRKPGRMRWEYSSPAGKIFLSDGKDTWLYSPDEQRAEKSSLKQSEDNRAPLAFLLGRLDFRNDFKSFETHNEGAESWIAALPKSQNMAYTRVEFLAGADGQIHKVRVTGQDQSKLEFSFSNEQLNAPVAPALFIFKAPAGVQIVEGQK
jgi:outer membrane lipoprotein carrier protein